MNREFEVTIKVKYKADASQEKIDELVKAIETGEIQKDLQDSPEIEEVAVKVIEI